MKIIKKERNIKIVPGTMKVTCKCCKTELRIDANDLQYRSSGNLWVYSCPYCATLQFIKNSELTNELKNNLKLK